MNVLRTTIPIAIACTFLLATSGCGKKKEGGDESAAEAKKGDKADDKGGEKAAGDGAAKDEPKATGPLAALVADRHVEIPASVIPGKHPDLWLKHNAAKRTADTIKAVFAHVKANCKVTDKGYAEPADCMTDFRAVFKAIDDKGVASFVAKGDTPDKVRANATAAVKAAWSDIADKDNPQLLAALLATQTSRLNSAANNRMRAQLEPIVLGGNKALARKAYYVYLKGGLMPTSADFSAASVILAKGGAHIQSLVPSSLFKTGMPLLKEANAAKVQGWLKDAKIDAGARLDIVTQLGNITAAKPGAVTTLEGVGKSGDPAIDTAIKAALTKLKG